MSPLGLLVTTDLKVGTALQDATLHHNFKLTNPIICLIPRSNILGDRGQETRRLEKGQLSGDNERMCRRRRRFVDVDAAPV